MGKPLRQTLEISLGDAGTVSINVTFRVLEVIERVYDMRAELVARDIFQYDRLIKRTQLARCVIEWLQAESVPHTRDDVYEAVMTATPETLSRYVGAIQGAILYSIKRISAEDMSRLAAGEGLGTDDDGRVEVETDDDAEKKSGAPSD